MTKSPVNWDQRMAVIAEIGQAVNAGLELDVILNKIMSLLGSLIDYTAAEISLWHEENQMMVVFAQAGDSRYTRQTQGVYRLDEGFSGWIAHHWQPLLIEDTFTSEDIQPQVVGEARPIRSFLGVPLQAGDNRFGTIELVSDSPHAFSPGDLELLQIIGQFVVAAIKHAQLIRTEQLRAEHIAAVHQVSTAANSTLDSSEIFRRVLVEMVKVFKLDQGGVTLFDHDGGYGYPLISYPPFPRFKGPTSPIPLSNNAVAEAILTHQRPIAVEDAARDANLAAVRATMDVWEIKSLLLVPLVIQAKVLGTIDLFSMRSKRKFSKNELELAATMASQVSTAIDNAQLYEQVAKRVSVLNTLYEAGRVVISSLKLDEILSRLAEQAWHLTTYQGKKIRVARISLVEGSKVRLAAFYPPEEARRADVGASREINLARDREASLDAVERAIKTGTPQLVGHLTYPLETENGQSQTRSELAVPIKLGREVIGAINVEHPDYNAFNQEDQHAFESLAAQAAIAIQNARLFNKTQRHARLLQAAAKVAREATGILNEDKLLTEAVNLIVDSFDFFYHAGVFLLDVERESAVLRTASSEGGRRMLQRGHKLKVGQQGIVGYVTQSGLPRLTPDVQEDPHHFKNLDLPETRAEMAFPLIARDQVIGALDVQSTQVVNLSAEDIATLQTMADQLANAIHNAQLYRAEQQYAQALKAIQSSSAAVSAILALDELLPMITEKAAEIFDMPAASLMLWDDRQQKLVIRAAVGLSKQYRQQQTIDRRKVYRLIEQVGVGPHVFNILQEPLGVPELVKQEGLHRVLVAPLTIGTRLIGTLNVYSKNESSRFDKKDEELATILANHTAIAIENAWRHESEQERVKELSGLNKISQAIGSLTDIRQVYQLINMSIAELAEAEMCAILLYDEARESLVCQLPAYGVRDELGRRYCIPLAKDGLTYAIWRAQGYLILNNAFESPLMRELGLSELAEAANLRDTMLVKLTVGNRDLGVIQASNKHDGTAFDEDDARLVSIFAGQAAAVIENARLYEKLKHAQGIASARTGLAWMGMANSAWRHAVDKHALTIREQTQLLRRKLNKFLPDEQYLKLEDRLSLIERVAGKILEKPLTLPLSAEAGIESVEVNELISERARQLWQNDPYKTARLQFELNLPTTTTVRVSPEWLRRAFDILVDNAVNATADCDAQRIKIGTRAVGNQAEIFVSDNGPGLPRHIMTKIGVEFIEKPEDSKGLGMGLIMAQTIVQTYGGEIRIGSTGPTGTTMVIALPLERSQTSP